MYVRMCILCNISFSKFLLITNTFSFLSFIPFNNNSAFYLAPNPLVIESAGLTSTIQFAPGILLTPFGALQEVRNHILWADLIAKHSNELKIDLDTFLGKEIKYFKLIFQRYSQFEYFP